MDDASTAYAVLGGGQDAPWYEEGEGFFQYKDGRRARLALQAYDMLIALGMVEDTNFADAMGEDAGRVTREQIQEAADAEPEGAADGEQGEGEHEAGED